MADVADDAISLFRINIFIIGVYVSLVALLSSTGIGIEQLPESVYTIFGLLFWLGTITSSIFTYRSARFESLGVLRDIGPAKKQIVRNVAGVGLGTLIVVITLAFGLFEVVTGTSYPPQVVIIAVFFGFGFVAYAQMSLRLLVRSIEIFSNFTEYIADLIFSESGLNRVFSVVWARVEKRIPSRLKEKQSLLSHWRDE